jgi:hypothetical protein
MAFELSNFAMSLPINMLIAEREGLARSDAVRVGAIASLLVNPFPMSIVVAQLLARREAPTEAIVATAGVTVPDVTLKSRDDASEQLKKAGLNSSEVEEASSAVQKDFVIRQQPKANTTAPAGSTIALTISKGPEPVPS